MITLYVVSLVILFLTLAFLVTQSVVDGNSLKEAVTPLLGLKWWAYVGLLVGAPVFAFSVVWALLNPVVDFVDDLLTLFMEAAEK